MIIFNNFTQIIEIDLLLCYNDTNSISKETNHDRTQQTGCGRNEDVARIEAACPADKISGGRGMRNFVFTDGKMALAQPRNSMNIIDKNIDGGKAFDWGRTSEDYAKYRDIYPQVFYDRIVSRNLCVSGQRVLDLGTGTGVLPRNMLRYGAKWVGTDISANQIEQAKKLSADTDIEYYTLSAENIDFPDGSFDVITACQCFWYFDHQKIMPNLSRMLAPDGRILVLYMAWLPFEDEIAGASEALVLKYSPNWSGARETMHPITIDECYKDRFELVHHEEYPLSVHFTRESWHGRMKACRGIGASLSDAELAMWESEHRTLLAQLPEEFDIRHYAALAELQKR